MPVAFDGLDTCKKEYDRMCFDNGYWPLPVAGLYGSILDHRWYFGMRVFDRIMWDEAGEAQFRFLTHPDGGQVVPGSYVLDIGCAALRLGRWLIPWLEPGHYSGIDKARRLIEAGYWFELQPTDRQFQQPVFAVSHNFELQLLVATGRPPPDVSWANSLITHLLPEDVADLLSKLRRVVRTGHRFYATYAKPKEDYQAPAKSEADALVRHDATDLEAIARATGWTTVPDSTVWHSVLRSVFGKSRVERQLMICFIAV